jgi:PRC-barrel domain
MAYASNRWASLRPVTGRPDARGWTVVGADGRKVGTVRDLLEDQDDHGARYLTVELDQTTMAQQTIPGGEATITAGAYPGDPNRPGSRPQADVDPSVGESERTAHFNVGARQHAGPATGAVPRDDDRQGGSARQEHPVVLIPFDSTVLKEQDQTVVLRTLREADLLELPVYTPVPA